MKKFSSALTALVMLVYFGGVGIFGVYYNYRFAKENSFMTWLLLGQFIPTIKAFAWPYYIFQNDYKAEMRALIDAHEMVNLGLTSFGSVAKSGASYEKDVETLENYFAAAEKSADKVTDVFLATVHPEMQQRFNQDFRAGIKLVLGGLRGKNEDMLYQGGRSLGSYRAWWVANHDSFKK